ncbi:hypothetical protein L596_001916 [Steinernema carpocapsae]|uniref:Uncharacterized protein n=1 Tax=Steinernema carpocapsae TaxID=34508 RepID=A0A4U8UMI0_STECR|nr:hypothetical protein L596_001916 [Steinernema carpocapsae]
MAVTPSTKNVNRHLLTFADPHGTDQLVARFYFLVVLAVGDLWLIYLYVFNVKIGIRQYAPDKCKTQNTKDAMRFRLVSSFPINFKSTFSQQHLMHSGSTDIETCLRF